MYKQITFNSSLRQFFFHKLYDFERLILHLEQFVTGNVTLVNSSQGALLR